VVSAVTQRSRRRKKEKEGAEKEIEGEIERTRSTGAMNLGAKNPGRLIQPMACVRSHPLSVSPLAYLAPLTSRPTDTHPHQQASV